MKRVDLDNTNCQAGYRQWADAFVGYLPLYWQPRWLDMVDSDWKACCEHDTWDSPRWVWPYSIMRKYSLSYMRLPSCTAYLGPLATRGGAVDIPLLPNAVKYGVYTSHQAAITWSAAPFARAMASQVISLKEPLNYSSELRRRLRRGNESLLVEPYSSAMRTEIEQLFIAQALILPKGIFEIMITAIEQGFGQLFVVLNDARELQAVGGLLWDERRAYAPFSVRATKSHRSANSILYAELISKSYEKRVSNLDLQAGFLDGSRKFFESFGAKPIWYAQVRVAKGLIWNSLEFVRKHTNSNRL